MKDRKDRELLDLYKTRVGDCRKFKTKRRKQLESDPKKLSGLLTSYFGDDSQTLNKIEENRALLAWDNYVGSAAARVSEALRIRAGQLTVKVTDPLWMQQLSLLKRELLKKYWRDFPKLKLQDIFFTRNG